MPPPLLTGNFTVFDTETTGLDPRNGHRIIEIAAVRIEGGVIREEAPFVSLVNPERPIPWEAKQVHKIGDEDLRGAPLIEEVLPKFLAFAQNSILVAHNADFDMAFLRSEKEFCWGYVELPECFCTMRLSQAVFPGEFRHNLDIVSSRLGIPLPAARHRALPDVLITAQAFLKMLQKAEFTSLEQLKNKAGLGELVKK